MDTVGAASNLNLPSTRDARHSWITPTAVFAATTIMNVASRRGPTTIATTARPPSRMLKRVRRFALRIWRSVLDAPVPDVFVWPARRAASTCSVLSPRRIGVFMRPPSGIPGRGRRARAVAAPTPAWEIQVCERVREHCEQRNRFPVSGDHHHTRAVAPLGPKDPVRGGNPMTRSARAVWPASSDRRPLGTGNLSVRGAS
ncbi:unannotated protein [freshwater metagenome]|uniref:Unannotated protein n=1 Tax=freshwater metagenome TaxID=449393 RepID=A0A6J6PK67_9ZZZZ